MVRPIHIWQVHLDNLFFGDDFAGGLKAIDFGNMIFSQALQSYRYCTQIHSATAVQRYCGTAVVRYSVTA